MVHSCSKETQVSSSLYSRACHVGIAPPHPGTPSIGKHEIKIHSKERFQWTTYHEARPDATVQILTQNIRLIVRT